MQALGLALQLKLFPSNLIVVPPAAFSFTFFGCHGGWGQRKRIALTLAGNITEYHPFLD